MNLAYQLTPARLAPGLVQIEESGVEAARQGADSAAVEGEPRRLGTVEGDGRAWRRRRALGEDDLAGACLEGCADALSQAGMDFYASTK